MDDLTRRVAALGDRIDPRWQPDDVERALGGMHRRRLRSRQRILAFALAGAVSAALLIVGVRGRQADERGGPAAVATPIEAVPTLAPGLELGDGARVEPLDADSEVLATTVAPDAVAVRLSRGGARFDVAAKPGRRFDVSAGQVALTVQSAAFAAYHDDGTLVVEVFRGEIMVAWPGGQQEVTAGQRTRFPLTAPRDATATVPPVASGARVKAPGPRGLEPSASWRVLADRGEFEAAHKLVAVGKPLTAMDDLLLAADIARLSNHADAAVVVLRRALAIHRGDPREPIAAFTLGRVLLDELGSPLEAAVAFARARAADPDGPLAEDSLAREVEGWSRGGDLGEAERAARAYVVRYPDGRRLPAVRRHGGLR